jgi:hypothetical protein
MSWTQGSRPGPLLREACSTTAPAACTPRSSLKPHNPSPDFPMRVSTPLQSKTGFLSTLRSDAQHSARPNKPQKLARQETNLFPSKVFETPDWTERTTFHARQLSEDETCFQLIQYQHDKSRATAERRGSPTWSPLRPECHSAPAS